MRGGKRPISVPFFLSLLFDGAASPYVLLQREPKSRGMANFLIYPLLN